MVTRYEDGAHKIAWFGNVELILSREAPSPAVMRRIVAELDALSHDCECRTGALLIIDSTCKPPSEEARTYIRKELARSSMVAAAQVVEGSGFRGAAMRAVLSVIQLASRPPYPMQIFSRVEDAASWLCPEVEQRAGVAPVMRDLVAAARECQINFWRSSSDART